MAQNYKTNQGDEQFLRKMFDFLYTVRMDDVRGLYKSTIGRIDRRTRLVVIIVAASLFLAWDLVMLLGWASEAMAWANRPPIIARLVAPYELESRTMPLLDPELIMANGEILADEYTYLPESVNGFTQQAATSAGLLSSCVLGQADPVRFNSTCTLEATPIYMEFANYTDAEFLTVEVVMTQFASDQDAANALVEMNDFSRAMGRIGNFAMVEARDVDYYYSSTRERFSFSWQNGPWLYTASSTDFIVLDRLLSGFPY